MNVAEVIVSPVGTVRLIFNDQIDVRSLGNVAISRGSHVEPTKDARWTADLSPVDGPILGPFDKRSEALAAEVAWLQQNWLTRSRK